MLTPTAHLLNAAEVGGYAIGAFNVYNLEGVRAVIAAAEAAHSPAMLQVHPAALQSGGKLLIALCLAAAGEASVPVAVQLDHSTSRVDIELALKAGTPSVMADGSYLDYRINIDYTSEIVQLAHACGATVEAELGRLTGTEDNITVAEYESKLTDPDQAADFIRETGADALAICIGNVHGHYRRPPQLDFERLARIRERIAVPLVLHGASGLPVGLIRRAIDLGVRKFNVNTEVREAYLQAMRALLCGEGNADLTALMAAGIGAMQRVVSEKLAAFGSTHRA